MKIFMDLGKVRLIRIEDSQSVFSIEKESYNYHWTLMDIKNEIRNHFSKNFLIENKNMIIGYVFTHITEDQMQINNLCIRNEYRKKGYAKILMSYILDYVKNTGVKKIFLEVKESNISAQYLYKQNGFKHVFTRKNFYSNGENALLMTKILQN